MSESSIVKSLESRGCPVCGSKSYRCDSFFGEKSMLFEFKCDCGYVLATTDLTTIIRVGEK